MNIINIEHISKLFGDKLIFDDASFGLQEGDKVGIVGINGTGKSTLLRIVAGDETPDSGQIIRQNNLKMAYLPQTPEFPKDATVLSYALSGDEEDWQVQSNLVQLGITEYDAKIDTLSGGQRRKVALAKVLASDFDVLILDEPTNHLDNAMLSWLEDYLKNYRGTVFMVTHDRYFLDKVSNRILEISHGKMYSYDSNYSRFLELKAEREEMELASERKRQSILRMELEWAKRGCRARSTKQRARLERLEVLKNGTAPTADAVVEMDAVETRMGKKTIEFHNVSKAFGDKTLMKDFEYIFLRNQSVGIIGPNGCGKSTMLRMITGEVLPDAGTIEIGDTIRIGYLAQEEPDMDTNQRVIDYVKDIAEYVQTRDGRISASQMLERFLFTPDMQYTPISKLSGGEKRRLYLLSVLVSGANVLILDEPSNNVDIPTLTVLEDFLNTFVGIVITVSHDRYFLDRIVTKVIEIENKKSTVYNGNYSFFWQQKEINREIQQKAYEMQQKEIKHQEDVIRTLRSFNREKSIKRAESREKALGKLERVDRPDALPDQMRLTLTPFLTSGNDVLHAEELSKSYGGQRIFRNVSFDVKRSDKVAIIGPNGVGKSTLFRMLLKEVPTDSGLIRFGTNVFIGYYDQEQAKLDESKTIFEEIADTYPTLTQGQIRNMLAAFVFTGDDVFKPISALSGGEKGRVSLAKIMLSKANLLMLDEPTNHLDMFSKEVLESALNRYEGTVIYISHDRYFINKTAEKILELTPEGVILYNGNYDYYLEKKAERARNEAEKAAQHPEKSVAAAQPVSDTKNDWLKQKEKQAAERRLANRIAKLEKAIEETEAAIAQADEDMAACGTDYGKANEIYAEKTKLEERLEALFAEWEELNS